LYVSCVRNKIQINPDKIIRNRTAEFPCKKRMVPSESRVTAIITVGTEASSGEVLRNMPKRVHKCPNTAAGTSNYSNTANHVL
jgi:hypothetical protein